MIAQNQKEFLINRIVDKLTEFLVVDSAIDLTDALKVVYNSKIYQQLQDIDGDLYVQSPSYIYELLKQEMKENQYSILNNDPARFWAGFFCV